MRREGGREGEEAYRVLQAPVLNSRPLFPFPVGGQTLAQQELDTRRTREERR